MSQYHLATIKHIIHDPFKNKIRGYSFLKKKLPKLSILESNTTNKESKNIKGRKNDNEKQSVPNTNKLQQKSMNKNHKTSILRNNEKSPH